MLQSILVKKGSSVKRLRTLLLEQYCKCTYNMQGYKYEQ